MRFSEAEFAKLKPMLVLYNCALKTVALRVGILLDDYTTLKAYNPIEHVKTRLKSPESIADKLARLQLDITADHARQHLFDIAGLRCICSYAKDIEAIAAALKRQGDLTIIREKDYVSRPKPNGYRSYHLIVDTPVYLSDRIEVLPVEVQIRTQAMDFWASLEHKVRYKYGDMPKQFLDELSDCAEQIAALDRKMYQIQCNINNEYTQNAIARGW